MLPSAFWGVTPDPRATTVQNVSVQIPLETLSEVAGEYGPSAYVVVGTADGPARITHSQVAFTADGELLVDLGRSSHRSLADRPAVAVLWPATNDQSMSLIVDGLVAGPLDVDDGGEVRITPTGAVRHRPA